MDRDRCRLFTRYVETAALRTGFAYEVADIFLQAILLHHGPPRPLLSDRCRMFLSALLAGVLDLRVLPTKQLQAITLSRMD